MTKTRWLVALAVLCLAVTAVAAAYAATQERPKERVTPAPEVNADAVVWRTPEPPKEPQAGDVWVNPKDQAEMVYVPAGEFTMGSTEAEIAALLKEYPKLKAEWFAKEMPQFRAHLPGYWIDKCEVTVARYRKFCQETGREMPEAPEWGWRDDHPIVLVTWRDAAAYARWAEKRLPTEMEWEKAARGTDGRKYPWGSQWPPPAGSGNFCDEAFARKDPAFAQLSTALGDPPLSGYDDGYACTAPVGKFPLGASPYGALDMAGNVWEWCADWYDEDAYQRYAKGDLKPPGSGTFVVLRGGSWNCFGGPRHFRCAGRCHPLPAYPFAASYDFGFRCARGP